jgi:hypothetical protein
MQGDRVGHHRRFVAPIASAASRRAFRPAGSINAAINLSKAVAGFAGRPGLPVQSDTPAAGVLHTACRPLIEGDGHGNVWLDG